MTNPTLEQRARELFEIARPNFHYAKRGTADGGAFEQSEIGRCLMNAMKAIASSPTFSHTGVEQAIEACAEVAEGCYADPKWPARDRATGQSIAAAIRATLPAQSPDDIAYAGAAPSPLNVEGLVETLRFIAGWCTDGREPSEALASIGECARKALASLSPDGER